MPSIVIVLFGIIHICSNNTNTKNTINCTQLFEEILSCVEDIEEYLVLWIAI